MMKMNFSFLKNAGSAFLVLLFVMMGTFVSAQGFSVNGTSGTEFTILKQYDSFVGKSEALQLLTAELEGLNANVPNGGNAEAIHTTKRLFLIKAGNSLKMDVNVQDALIAGYYAINAESPNYANGISVSTDDILTLYAELLSN